MTAPFSDGSPRRAALLLVDDHPIVRQGLLQLLGQEPDFAVAGEAGNADEALAQIERHHFDLVVLDVGLQDASGIDLIGQIRARRDDLPILMLSMHHERFYAERALRAGAQGYVMKQRSPAEVVTAIRTVLGGGLYLSPELADLLLRRAVDGRADAGTLASEQLSDREVEVLRLIGAGLGTREIADDLKLSVKTVESYRANIKRKLGLKSGTELTHYAFRWVNEAVA